jgi:hypothetical protein
VSNATYLVGDVRRRLAEIPNGSIDLVLTSWPYWLQRSYLPDDAPEKELEIGQELTVADYLTTLLEVTALMADTLAPHGSMALELADTYSGSGGAGGDYREGHWREGQPRPSGSAAANVARSRHHADRPNRMRRRADDEALGIVPRRDRRKHEGEAGVIPPDKSLCMIPELYRIALAYGIHPLTGEPSPAGMWRCRNVVLHCRPNPSPGADGDKFRPAKSDWVIATRSRTRYWDGFDVRIPSRDGNGMAPMSDHWWEDDERLDQFHQEEWYLGTNAYEGAHYATFSPLLIAPMIHAMCPWKVCRVCGEPSRRIVERESTGQNNRKSRAHAEDPRQDGAVASSEVPDYSEQRTVGWTACGCDSWRPGVVLDPFGGSGTTAMVATGNARDAILIDLDGRNVVLAEQRLGMFLSSVVLSGQEATWQTS